jgi:hypothetical protein
MVIPSGESQRARSADRARIRSGEPAFALGLRVAFRHDRGVQKNILKGYANTACQMFSGWRILVSPGDLPLLLDAARGTVQVDLLTGNATLDGAPANIGMAREVAAWLREQAEKDGVPWDSLREATMRVKFDLSEVEGSAPATRVRRFIFDGTCVIGTDDQTYEGGFRKDETSIKVGDGPWIA